MLKALQIEDFAIVDRLEIEFRDGLNVLTGETGAGKSIVVDAISMLMGERASPHKVRAGSDRSVIEGLFGLEEMPEDFRSVLDGMGIDAGGGELILRRDIYAAGAGRSYLNGRMVSASILAEIGECLCDIHGQHQHQTLLKNARQLDLLDGYARTYDQRILVGAVFRELREIERDLERLRLGREERGRRICDLRYAVEEIEKAALKTGEEEELDGRIKVMQNFQHLDSALGVVLERFAGEGGSILESLGLSLKDLEDAVRNDPALSDGLEEARNCYFQIEDLSRRFREYRDRLASEPALLDELLGRRELIRRLKAKYGGSIPDVIAFRERAVIELESLETGQTRAESLEARRDGLKAELREKSDALSVRRRNGARKLERELLKGLKELGMDRARFRIGFQELPEGGADSLGAERISFLISANPGEPEKPLSEVVSGGELSRIMLALRALQAKADEVRTLVFDEVDSGIGGRVAHAVGERLLEVSRGRQVFVITHLPQIAARAHHHFCVEKRTEKGRPKVVMAELDGDGRVAEIVRMLGGSLESEVSRRHARELLDIKR